MSQKLADRILKLIDQYSGNASFVEIEREFPEFRQPKDEGFSRVIEMKPNCVLWSNVSEEGMAALRIAEQAADPLRFKPTPILVYMIDGGWLQLPLAKRLHAYKKPHWFPVVLCRKSYIERHLRNLKWQKIKQEQREARSL